MAHLNEAIAQSVIEQDQNSFRFERFCNALISDAYEGGNPILPTSSSWDLGRDGRAHGAHGSLFSCCSLRDDVDKKARDDIARLVQYSGPIERIYFCTSQRLSEKGVETIKRDLVALLPSPTPVIVLGSTQLAYLAEKYPNHIERDYQAEVRDVLDVLRGGEKDEPTGDSALRLALTTAAHSDSESIRNALYASAIRVALSDRKPRGLGECVRDVTHQFHLGRQLPSDTVKLHLERLVAEGEISFPDGRYSLTPKGVTALTEQEAFAAASLLDGRNLVRGYLTRELGYALADDQVDRLWRLLEEKLTALFYERGLQIVRSITDLLEGRTSEPQGFVGMDALAPEIADAISDVSSDPGQRAEVRTAIRDLLLHPEGDVLKWLLQLCSSYVAICSMGLESESGLALGRLISRIALILDTDVVLSLLNEGEAYHESALAVAKRWRALGGELLLAAPVLREVAYHSSIADIDFDQVERWLPGSETDRDRLIENAFVRGFATLLALGKARKGQWRSYITQFRGTLEYDGSRVAETLKADFDVSLLPPRSSSESTLEEEVTVYLKEVAERSHSGRALKIARDKAGRDAALFSAMVSYRRAARARDAAGGCLLVTSARRLSEVEGRFTEQGDPHVVISLAGVIHLLTLVPNARLSLGSMRAILFDRPGHRFSDALERAVLSGPRTISWTFCPLTDTLPCHGLDYESRWHTSYAG